MLYVFLFFMAKTFVHTIAAIKKKGGYYFQKKSAVIFISVLFSLPVFAGYPAHFDSILITTNVELKNKSYFSQTIFPAFEDTIPVKPLTTKQINRRIKIIAATNIIGYGGAMAGLYAAWYKNYPQSNFHVFNDINEWKGIDKLGHAYSVYAESLASTELWRWTGMSRKKRIWIGGLSGPVYHTVIEVLDGFSSEWGWSWGDIAANFSGSGLLIAQELAWDEQRIQFKMSFHRMKYNDPTLNTRSDKIFGTSTAERFLKDYNGQTYWLSTNVRSFFPQSKWPAWLNIAIGTGAEGMFGAFDNIGKDENGNIIFNRTDIKRYRQWYLAPDIDLSKIKTNKKGIKLALRLLNVIKFPAPALEFSNGSFKIKAIAF